MAYSDFTLRSVKKQFQLSEKRTVLFDKLQPVACSAWLEQTLSMGQELALTTSSEKARSEFIVAPILLELRQRNPHDIGIYSGELLDVDKEQGLNGECDFIITQGEQIYALQAPVLMLVEAKKNDLVGGFGQCVAQMVGARLFNQGEGHDLDTIFGCVTTGTEWQFLKLTQSTIFIDSKVVPLEHVGLILAMLQQMVDFY